MPFCSRDEEDIKQAHEAVLQRHGDASYRDESAHLLCLGVPVPVPVPVLLCAPLLTYLTLPYPACLQ